MIKFNAKIAKIKLDTKKWTKKLDSSLEVFQRKAARVFIRELVIHVPVWSGIARGSIKFAEGPKGALARFLNVMVPINPRPDAPKHYFHDWVNKKVPKTPEEGGDFGHYNFTSARHVFTFSFSSSIVHYVINEFMQNVSPTSPWHSLQKATAAYRRFVDEELRKSIPNITDFVTTT